MLNRLNYLRQSLRDRLWLKPIFYIIAALGLVFFAKGVDYLPKIEFLLDIKAETLIKLLTITSSSMLGIATFAVASMVSAYASASGTATPRAFKLVVSDNMTQHALSRFVGAYIFGVIGLVFVESNYLGFMGRFAMFIITLLVLGWVVFTFVFWVDNIARLGRMGDTVSKVETATRDALEAWGAGRRLGCAPGAPLESARALVGEEIGYVQYINLDSLQEWADAHEARIFLEAAPGGFVTRGRVLAHIDFDGEAPRDVDLDEVRESIIIDVDRSFAHDPRFGFISLSEIAARALSPAVNDPGTAIDIVGRLTRLFSQWDALRQDKPELRYPRLHIAQLEAADLFEDAFSSLERDGAGMVEIGVRLQKAFGALEALDSRDIGEEARKHARLALARAQKALDFEPDMKRVREAAV